MAKSSRKLPSFRRGTRSRPSSSKSAGYGHSPPSGGQSFDVKEDVAAAAILDAQASVPPEPPSRALPPLGMMEALNLEIAAKRAAKGKPPALIASIFRLLGNLLLIALALTPAFVTTDLVSTYSVNTPYGDDWNLVDHLENLHHDHPSNGATYAALSTANDASLPAAAPPRRASTNRRRSSGGCLDEPDLDFIDLARRPPAFAANHRRRLCDGAALLDRKSRPVLLLRISSRCARPGSCSLSACLMWAHLFASFHISTVLKFAACAVLATVAAASAD